MENILTLRELYEWTRKDEENLKGLVSLDEGRLKNLVEYSYKTLQKYPDWAQLMNDPKVEGIHTELLLNILKKLLTFEYDEDYTLSIKSLASFYMKTGLNPKYFGSILSSIRESIFRIFIEGLECDKVPELSVSLNKAIDMAISMFSIAYREEELQIFTPIGKLQKLVISKIRLISWAFDYFIVGVLTVVGVFILAWIIYEIYLIAIGALPVEKGGLSILGSTLILYAISELITEEIKHIKGSIISLKVFVSVALAAVIRKILIVSLSPEKIGELITLGLVLVALAGSFWLIHKVEQIRTS